MLQLPPLALYVHIPWCVRKCPYCDFNSHALREAEPPEHDYVTALLADEEYRALQNELLEDPERGVLIQGGGGIRKLRFAARGHGKRGGVRVIYYWAKDRHQVYFLVVYPKSRKDDLSDGETAILRELVKGLRDGNDAVQ